ncbi:hypothetical protein POVWA2_010720 [Plasmodium ovale wallikeri]|uniref:Uncharacterized protein n=1 Tax=Plasmodium ovale wallikeri TaxID=864142 RepID=A0A1A8YMQ9_PLAOA|nr:hypothetical protein POVWA1_010580 [Plasmodium ovale wallikeri]SBT32653.1 hypothetical protein POVWA2_010720 [Plasmodium ovale wallikeri]
MPIYEEVHFVKIKQSKAKQGKERQSKTRQNKTNAEMGFVPPIRCKGECDDVLSLLAALAMAYMSVKSLFFLSHCKIVCTLRIATYAQKKNSCTLHKKDLHIYRHLYVNGTKIISYTKAKPTRRSGSVAKKTKKKGKKTEGRTCGWREVEGSRSLAQSALCPFASKKWPGEEVVRRRSGQA